MLIKCPSCGGKIRVKEAESNEKVITYYCPECQKIVKIDLISDVIPTSSSSGSGQYRVTPRQFRVLIVDDSRLFVKTAEDLLAAEGYLVTSAQDGMEGLKKLLDERPDLLVLDLSMPRMTGFEVLNTLRTNAGYRSLRQIPVLVTSGVYHAAEIEMIHELGANGFLKKEAVYESLVYRVRQLLPQRQLPPTLQKT
jgi:CheY-like chemotaxis protein/endogenous inhibitor of DNA gyrase (YacG/DUF329 family)